MAESCSDDERLRSEDEIDRALLERVAAHDRDALTALYQRYQDRLLRFIYRLTQDLGVAQEGVNDVMWVVWTKAGSFGGRSRVSTWIMGIAYRKAMKLGARLRRWSLRFKAADWHDQLEPTTGIPGLTDELLTQDLLYRALEQLSANHRAVVELTYFFGFSYEEIAEIVQCPQNTVKTRMFHARAHLRKLLPGLGGSNRDD